MSFISRQTEGRWTRALILGTILLPPLWVASLAAQAPNESGSQPVAPEDEDRWKNKPVSFWVMRLEHKEVVRRQEAVQALATIGPGAHAAVPALIRALDDDESVIREGAINALGQIGPRAEAAVPALVGILRDKDFLFQLNTFKALRLIGPEDNDTALVLARLMLYAKANTVQTDAASTLQALGPKIKGALPLFKEALSDPKLRSRHLPIVIILEAIGLDSAPLLAEAVLDEDPAARDRAAAALQRLGSAAEGTLPALKQALRSKDGGVRSAALTALTTIDPEAVSLLAHALADDNEPRVRKSAAEGLAALGPKASPAAADLIRALSDRAVTGSADRALTNIGSNAIPGLVEAMNEDPRRVLPILAEMGPQARAAVPSVMPLLKDKSEAVRAPARSVLTRVGEEAVPALMNALREKDPDQACLVLGAIGPSAKAAVPELLVLLKDPSPRVRARTAQTLGLIGPAASDALPLLRDARKDGNAELAREADQALLKIRGE